MNRYHGMSDEALIAESLRLRDAIADLTDEMMASKRRSDAWRERYEALLARTPSKY